VSDESQVKNMMQEIVKLYWRLDILVNNVWWYIEGDEWNGSSDVREKTLKNNLISSMNTSKYATEIFQKQHSSVIVNVASRHALSWQIDATAYAAAKAGIISITQAYAKLLSPFWRANAVCPWATNAWYRVTAPQEELDEAISHAVHKRLIEPEEIADVILFLASDKTTMINWQNILVDWGRQ
jgi:3-oxoacyl-[acyl-carrier protein] reductase